MGERYTIKDCRVQFERAVGAARANGIDTSTWTLHPGSSTIGVSWKLIGPGMGSFSHIGRTAKEAHAVLSALAFAWELAARTHAESERLAPPCDCGRQIGEWHTAQCAQKKSDPTSTEND